MQSPILLINQINSFKEYCKNKQVEVACVSRANSLIPPVHADEAYSSEAYNALRDFMRAAVNYFLETNKQYTWENLHQFQPTFNDTKQSQSIEKPTSTTQSKPSRIISKREPSPINANAFPIQGQNSKSTKSLSKTPASLTPPRSDSKQISAKSVTPKHNPTQKTIPNEMTRKQSTPFTRETRTSSPQQDKTSNFRGTKSPIQSRDYRESNLATPQPKRKQSLNKSYDDVRRKSLAESEKQAGHTDLKRKIEKVLDDKTARSAAQTPKKTFSRVFNNPEDKTFLEEFAMRLQLEEETQVHKKVARDFKQRATKLLLEHDKQVLSLLY